MDEDFFQKSELYQDLYYVTKGREKCAPNHSYGPNIREYYLIHIILEGKGYCETETSKFNLSKGQFFVIFPDEQTFYQADEENPWEYIWFGFDGRVAEAILSSMGINRQTPIGSIKNFNESKELVENMVGMQPFEHENRIQLQGMLYWLISLLDSKTRDNNIKPIEKINRRIVYTHDAIDLIKQNYQNVDFLIGDISEQLSLNESYLTSIFRQVTGRTLHEYLIDYRIQKSREYLETTDFNVREVAEKVGYKNPLSFTRVFKRKIGMTPTEYKKTTKKR
ncbi:AraC-type DNA-binding protein [Desemzia incerta]|uniref:AraC-type DNA-binding protein n=1 Tax=Desemzia incerta TaxID=82801 RepID=A0A1I5X5K8_9LACT|nr:AraC family transcriptional regulator [Desemzia incerta]SFQ26937.1 AraC-type DNA-binding protein [Desemzia incerta]